MKETSSEALKNDPTGPEAVGVLTGMGRRFLAFGGRFGGHFRQRTRTVETAAQQYVQGLIQAETKNMERMEEGVPEADHRTLQHTLSESAWSERVVPDQVTQQACRLLGGDEETALIMRFRFS